MNVVRAAATAPRPRPGTWARSWPLPLITLLGAMACGESFILKQPPAEDPSDEDPALDPDDDQPAHDAGRSRRSDAGTSKRTDAGAKRGDAGAPPRGDAGVTARGDAGASARAGAGATTRTESASNASSAAPGATKPAPDETNKVSLPAAEAETVATSPADGDELVSPPVQPVPNDPPVGRVTNDPPAGPGASSPAPMPSSAATSMSPTPATTAPAGLAPAQPDTSALPSAGPGGNSQPATNSAIPSPAQDAGVAGSAVATSGCTQREGTWRITYATVHDGCFMVPPGTMKQHVVNMAEGAAAIGAAAGLSGCLDRSVKSATECSLQVDLDCPAPAPLNTLGLRGRLTGTLTFASASVSGSLSINVSRADVSACDTSVEARGVPGT